MNNTENIFYTSSEFQKGYQRRSNLLLTVWSLSFFVNCYCFWIIIAMPERNINSTSGVLEFISAFNPFNGIEDYIYFFVFGVFLSIAVGASIYYWTRVEGLKNIKTKALKITSMHVIQEFCQKETHKILWSQVSKVIFLSRNKEILYIEIYESNGSILRIYGLEQWDKIIQSIHQICQIQNISIEQSNARIRAKGAFIGSIDLIALLNLPIATLALQLKYQGLKSFYEMAIIMYGALVIFSIISSNPLDKGRSNYKYWTSISVITMICIFLFVDLKSS
jgi:hypothetical protein